MVSLFLLGCVADRFRSAPSPGLDRHQTITTLTEKAAMHERADEIQLALLCWRRILEFAPDHTDAQANLKRLEDAVAQRALASYQSGKAALAQTRPQDARRAFLLTLRLDPQFAAARQQLETFMNPPVFHWYSFQPGETLADLSQKFYRTPDGAELIAFVNDIPVNAEVLVPRILKIPVLAAQPPFETQKTNQALARARALAEAGQHEKAITITGRLLRADPKLQQARTLHNNSCFVLGRRFYDQQQYLQAKAMLDQIKGAHEGLRPLRTRLKEKMKEQAEIHYREGVKLFLNDDLQPAVEAWRRALTLNPEHQEAAASIREAETLLQKLKAVDHE
jgi:tetratricopeptide (TPR) repeat protein